MQRLIQTLIENLPVGQYITVTFLLMARLAPLVFVAPFFGGRKIPAAARMAAVFALMVALWPAAWASGAKLPSAWAVTSLLILKEALVGTILALMASVLFAAVESAGRLVDVTRGAHMSQVLTPQTGEASSPLGVTMLLVAVVLFMGVNGHHLVIEAVGHSYQVIPLHRWPSEAALAGTARLTVWLGSEFFLVAVGLAAPVLAVVFLTEMALGLAGRLAPQMPSYFVGLPLKGYVALFVFLLVTMFAFRWLEKVFLMVVRLVEAAVRTLGA